MYLPFVLGFRMLQCVSALKIVQSSLGQHGQSQLRKANGLWPREAGNHFTEGIEILLSLLLNQHFDEERGTQRREHEERHIPRSKQTKEGKVS